MRIITGTARGARLETLEGEEITRPTTEKVKEGIFSAIQFDVEGRNVLDLFAGSGQLGLEALSRGAESCVFVDANDKAAAIVKKNAQKTKLYQKTLVLCSGYKEYIKSAKGARKFDLVFLDPPYAEKMLADALEKLAEAELLSEGAVVVCESDAEITDYDESAYELKKVYRYGKTFVTMLCAKRKEA